MTEPSERPDNAAPAGAQKRSRLTRIAHDLRQRDWIAIGIELAVVIVGILIAFQIDQWGRERDARRDERQFLQRLYSEYGRAADEMRSLITMHSTVVGDFRQVFAHREDPAMLGEFAQRPNFGCPLPRMVAAPFNDTNFEELVASGRISVISDTALRDEIRTLAAAQAASARNVDAARDLIVSLLPEHDRYIRFTMTEGLDPNCVVDWNRMLDDKAAMATIVRAYYLHENALAGRRRVLEDLTVVRRHIARKLGKNEA